MKELKLLGFFVVLVLFVSCNKSDPSNKDQIKGAKISIEGTFKNGTGRSVVLQMIGRQNFISLDTVNIDENGNFRFETRSNRPEFYIIRTENQQYINLLLFGKEKVSVIADYNDIRDYTVEGSQESEKIRQLNIKTNHVINEIDRFNTIARDSSNSPNYTALRMQANEDYQVLMTELRNYSLDFINQNKESLVSLLALYGQVGPQMYVFHPLKDLEIYEKTDSSLFSKYPDLPVIQSLHEYVTVIRAQIAAQEESTSGTFPPGTGVPDISLPSPEGKVIKLSSLKGKVVLLDFWAAWCQPCRHENPNLVENYSKYNKKGFEIYQVSLDRTREDWVNGIKQDNLKWIHVSDLKYWDSPVVAQFGIRGIPMNYLLDKDGKVIASNLRGAALGEKLAELFP